MSRLRLEYANCLADRVGTHGISASTLEAASRQMSDLTQQLNSSKGTGMECWRLLPFDPLRTAHLEGINSLTKKHRDSTDNLVVLGIGGSALGNIALHNALCPLTYNLMPRPERDGPRIFVLDNVDPQVITRTFAEIKRTDPSFERTLVNVISKSGETAETAALFMIARGILSEAMGDKHSDHIVAITDPKQGTMRSICDEAGYETLPVPEGVGGRFSVLSPVGLFSSAMCGIDIKALLDGAAEMDERCCEPDIRQNPAAMLAFLLIELTRQGKINHVLMPYCNALYSLADWYRQLWAESLGKRVDLQGNEVFAGATPIKALGTTDQHSQIQLYREGPNDKVIGFVEVETWDDDVCIPAGLGVENLSYLEGVNLSDLLKAEKKATEYALVESQRPNFTITLPRLDAHCVGQFIQMWEIATAYAGLMLNINPYDQPAVETGKVATFGLMGRAGYEGWKDKVEKTLDTSSHMIE
ncbi:MAG: glucose-6-phosphate isomerase [Planctomycetes bacterium]|nr:glucose-6-phosphate isomerase [Planctomycetota bacterium]